MNLKCSKIIAVIGIFMLSFVAHFMYDLFPCVLVSFFFPVNESIWEHMKILYTSTLIYGIIDYIILRFNNIKFNNFSFQLFFTSFISIVIYLGIYLPIYHLIGEVLWVSILLMFIVYSISQYMSYLILNSKVYYYLNYISIPLIITIYILFIILTFNPPNTFLFYDSLNKYYGIKKTIVF